MSKPADLNEVKRQIELCAVTGVLATTYHRITAGDLAGARGVMVIILDRDGLISHEMSDSLESCVSMCMASVTAGKIGRDFEAAGEE